MRGVETPLVLLNLMGTAAYYYRDGVKPHFLVSNVDEKAAGGVAQVAEVLASEHILAQNSCLLKPGLSASQRLCHQQIVLSCRTT